MPGTNGPSRGFLVQEIADLRKAITALQTAQQQVITDPTGATGDAAHGHATYVIGYLPPITGLTGYGAAAWNGLVWVKVSPARSILITTTWPGGTPLASSSALSVALGFAPAEVVATCKIGAASFLATAHWHNAGDVLDCLAFTFAGVPTSPTVGTTMQFSVSAWA